MAESGKIYSRRQLSYSSGKSFRPARPSMRVAAGFWRTLRPGGATPAGPGAQRADVRFYNRADRAARPYRAPRRAPRRRSPAFFPRRHIDCVICAPAIRRTAIFLPTGAAPRAILCAAVPHRKAGFLNERTT
ncbi:hypothetical protein [Burkholderia sp. A2]|uniref:hypothetical protein n=1 Tax=Burkholderia sp. A2 TaxID=236253 RepID=UPI00159F1A34|nr:hypothetical protein [Burkholderia sp. A2]